MACRSCCTSKCSTRPQDENTRFVWSSWHEKSMTQHIFLPALSWKPQVNERSGRGIEDQHSLSLNPNSFVPWGLNMKHFFRLHRDAGTGSFDPPRNIQEMTTERKKAVGMLALSTFHLNVATPP
eukprot:s4351_g4.t1